MAVTPKTLANLAPRKSNGAGWGGPARGAGHRYTKGDPMAAEGGQAHAGVSWGEGKRRKIAELMEEAGAREVVAERWLAILNDPEHPHHAAMVEKAALRLDGAPEQRIAADVQMQDGIDRPPATSREEWLARRNRELQIAAAMGAAAGSAD